MNDGEVVDAMIVGIGQKRKEEVVDMGQMNMFKTLDMVYVGQPNKASLDRQKNPLLTISCDGMPLAMDGRPALINSDAMLRKSQKSMIKVVDDYEPSLDDGEDVSYDGPFVPAANINADLD